MRQLPRRDGAVHADIVGDASGRPEGGFAALPDRGRFHRGLALLHRLDAVFAGDGDDAGELGVHLGVGALNLDDQQRLDIHRIAGMGERLADLDRRLVHELHRDRDDAGPDDRGHRLAGLFAGREAEQDGARALGRAQDAHGRLGDDAELPFRADDEAEDVEAGRESRWAPPISTMLPSSITKRDTEDIVGGDAVFQAVRAARVHADIAADRAGELGGRVRARRRSLRPITAPVTARLVTPACTFADAVGVVDLEDAVHLGDADHDRVLLRDRAARERGAGAARDHRHALFAAKAEHRSDLLRGRGQNDRQRHAGDRR